MKNTSKNKLFWIIVTGSIIGIYVLVYLCFKGRVGFSPGINLQKSDWLSFLGDYLGFASSTLLAIAVFKQDKKINDLTLAEYKPNIVLHIAKYERLHRDSMSKYVKISMNDHVSIFRQYVLEPAVQSKTENSVPTKSTFRIYFTVKNYSKLQIRDFEIKRIEMESDDEVYCYTKDIDKNLIKIEHIQTGGGVNFCLSLKKFPVFESSKVYSIFIWYSLKSGEIEDTSNYELLLSGDETTLFERIENFEK